MLSDVEANGERLALVTACERAREMAPQLDDGVLRACMAAALETYSKLAFELHRRFRE